MIFATIEKYSQIVLQEIQLSADDGFKSCGVNVPSNLADDLAALLQLSGFTTKSKKLRKSTELTIGWGT